MGRLMTKNAEPMTVATRQAGRTNTTSATIAKGSLSSDAKLELALHKLMASTQIAVNSLVFISFTIPQPGPFVERILKQPGHNRICSRASFKSNPLIRPVRLVPAHKQP